MKIFKDPKKLSKWGLRIGLNLSSFESPNQIKQFKTAYAKISPDCQTSFKVKFVDS